MGGLELLLFAAAGEIIKGLIGLGEGQRQSDAYNEQGTAARQLFEANAAYADMQSQDAIARGNLKVRSAKLETRQAIGAQRAAYAAQGIELSEGVTQDVTGDTAELGAENIVTIKNNAWRESFGYRMEASNLRKKGYLAELEARNMGRSSVATGGLNALNSLFGVASKFATYGNYPGVA